LKKEGRRAILSPGGGFGGLERAGLNLMKIILVAIFTYGAKG